MQIAFKTKIDEVLLTPMKESEEPLNNHYHLLDSDARVWMKLSLKDNQLTVLEQDLTIDEDDELIQSKLDELILQIIEQEQNGVDDNESSLESVNPYNPDLIKVNTKSFSIKLIQDMIESGDIDLNPNFQRNLVWSRHQKSRLIESILLRIPLPMFYFSEDEEGLIDVVDGLQRLNTIKEFIDNKFPLKGLEYLKESCEERYYKDDKENNLKGLDAKYFRWFNMTQLTVNVIDPASPAKVKYDIFRRINTGVKPLNNQEIRNCLASQDLRDLLARMTDNDTFKEATGYSIKSTRMIDQEMALRFICFYDLYEKDSALESYNGNMESLLDETVERLNKVKVDILSSYNNVFFNAMKNANYVLDKYAFRKIQKKDLIPNAHKKIINKALFVSWSVLLSQYDFNIIKENNEPGVLAESLATAIEEDRTFFDYLSYGTNGKANLQSAFFNAKNIIEKHLKF